MDITEVCGETSVEWDTIKGVVLTFYGTFDLGGKLVPSKIMSSSKREFVDMFGPSKMIS